MEIIQKENVKVSNSLIVKGLTHTKLDEELFDYLKEYGSIARLIPISDPESEHYRQVIVEYTYGTAVQSLESSLLLEYKSISQPEILFSVNTLASIYTVKVGRTATEAYLEELRDIAELSGKSFVAVLQAELSRMHESVSQAPLSDIVGGGSEVCVGRNTNMRKTGRSPDTCTEPIPGPPSPSHNGASEIPTFPVLDTHCARKKTHPYTDIFPPEVQRVVVEHVVRNGEVASQSQAFTRISAFSGRSPCPMNESDYDTWRTSVELLLQDPTISDLNRSRRIIESLLPPAAGMIKPLGPTASPRAYLELIDSAFGPIEEGDELFARFLNTFQNAGEKPSSYLQRLQVALITATKRGAVNAGESGKLLLKQFCRGCWDGSILTELQLEQKKTNPPTFPALLLMIRTEEDRQAAKTNRMRQHLGVSKQRAVINAQVVCGDQPSEPSTVTQAEFFSETQKLNAQIAQLQAQLEKLTPSSS